MLLQSAPVLYNYVCLKRS